MKTILFTGPPLSGKTSIAQKFAAEYDALYVSSGDVARNLAKGNSVERNRLDRGELFSPSRFDREMIHLLSDVKREADQSGEVVVLDGYPRYWQQLADLMIFLELKWNDIAVVDIFATADQLKSRLGSREDRTDDTEAAFLARYSTWATVTSPMVQYLATRGLVALSLAVSKHEHENPSGLLRRVRLHTNRVFGHPQFLAGGI